MEPIEWPYTIPTLRTIGSSSKGNAYILTAGGKHLLIECGLPFKSVLKALRYNVDEIVGCIATHRHKDHVGYIKQYKDYAIKVYSNPDNPDTLPLQPKQTYTIGGFKVMPLPVPHGDCTNYAYVIEHPDCGRIVFCTDAEDFPYNIPDVTSLIIEANYSEDLLVDALMENKAIHSQSHTHMEIGATTSIVERLLSPKLMRVILIHLSGSFSDERAFKSRICEVSGFAVVHSAASEPIIDISKEPF